MPALGQHDARQWIDRWERQQEDHLPDREERFTALIDAVEAGTGRADPLVIDLGSGPGSLSVRLLDRLPDARVVAVDTDPVTLALGRAAYAGRPACVSPSWTCARRAGRRAWAWTPRPTRR